MESKQIFILSVTVDLFKREEDPCSEGPPVWYVLARNTMMIRPGTPNQYFYPTQTEFSVVTSP